MKFNVPRVVIAGLSGGSGKTLVSVGLASTFRAKGLKVSTFKKGPDYIDTLWLEKASSFPSYNLDTFIMSRQKILASFCAHSLSNDISLIEGNRGIFDGLNSEGLHSTAELAKILKAPIILVINSTKMTRTASAIVWGIKNLDLALQIEGVVINNFSGERHRKVVEQSIEEIAKVKVVGAIPRLDDFSLLPSRHLGLITPHEFDKTSLAIDRAKEIVGKYLDLDQIFNIAQKAEEIDCPDFQNLEQLTNKVKIGYFYDEAFSFYYQDNLESLKQQGAELIPISPIHDQNLPEIDGIYIGGGFPELYADRLSKNKGFIEQFRSKINDGLPCFAECGGLMYLSEKISLEIDYPMAGILPIGVSLSKKPVGHGYVEAEVDYENPFFEVGEKIKGHEFHYSFVSTIRENIPTALKLIKGVGVSNSRDGFVLKNVFASYMHIHSLGCANWAKKFAEFCWNSKNIK
ncbi:MAG: cobyrinate a,c-diamide synthase [Candidatus Kapaibacteriales bacterium]